MASYMTERRRELDLKPLNFAVPRDVAKHIAQCALDSGMRQSAFMTAVLASAKPFPVDEAGKPTLKLVEA